MKIAEKWPNWDNHNIFTYIVGWFLNVYSISTYIGHVFYVKSLRIATYSIIYKVRDKFMKIMKSQDDVIARGFQVLSGSPQK